jgi:hypothetical protein
MVDLYYIHGERRGLHENVKTADGFGINSEPRSVASRDPNARFAKIKQRRQIFIIHGERLGLYGDVKTPDGHRVEQNGRM